MHPLKRGTARRLGLRRPSWPLFYKAPKSPSLITAEELRILANGITLGMGSAKPSVIERRGRWYA